VLDAIVCYNSLPHRCLYDVVVTLCTTLNRQALCDESWKITKNLLGTHLGHSCVQTMCKLLEKGDALSNTVLRSAVFYLGMGLWGSKCVSSLTHKPQSILPYFQRVLGMSDPVVAFEVSLSCQRLVKKYGHDLPASAWDSLLSIVPMLLNTAAEGGRKEPYRSLGTSSHDLLSLIEKLYQIRVFEGSVAQLFEVVEAFNHDRPTDSLLLLLAHKAEEITPLEEQWIPAMHQLMEQFFNAKRKPEVRLKALEVFSDLVLRNYDYFEKELTSSLILPLLSELSTEAVAEVRSRGVELLVKLALLSKTEAFHLLAQCLQPVVFDFFEAQSTANVTHLINEEDSRATVGAILSGLRQIVREKFGSDQFYHCSEAYLVLVAFLKSYYEKLCLLQPEVLWEARRDTLLLLTSLRANSEYQLKLVEQERYNARVLCIHEAVASAAEEEPPVAYSETSTVVLSFRDAFSCFVSCVEKEKYWPVLDALLQNMNDLLDNRNIVFSVDRSAVRALTDVTSALISNPVRPSTLVGTADTFKRADLQCRALSVLARLAFFRSHLDVARQRQILRCVESGFTSRSAKQCINVITLCIVEMNSDSLVRVLPSILLHLSQMSATVRLATAVLELLSTLSQLPGLYAYFNEDQYMSVFAVALEHATPAKFSLYVVSLAHHVVYTWFVKCRLSFRPDFVQFITRKLQNVNRDCAANAFQHSLVESSIDVLARYTFSNCMPLAANNSRAQGTLRKKQTATWLLGNRLITITTDGSLRRASNGDGTEAKGVDSSPSGVFERRVSMEAPAKLQSSSGVPLHAARARHKSGGGSLRGPGDENPETANCNEDLLSTDKAFCVTDEENYGAEICIRRPSGNTTFVLSSQQLRLLAFSACGSGPEAKRPHASLSKSVSIEVSSCQNGAFDNERPEFSRQRSRTVSSSHDFQHDAAQRAAMKAKQQRMESSSTNKTADDLKRADVFLSVADTSNTEYYRITPGFIFLQLFQSAAVADSMNTPLLLPRNNVAIDRAVLVLDMIPPYDTWSTGVVYVRPGQTSDMKAILLNEHGSTRYQQFLASLGRLVTLTECNSKHTYLGGLDQSGEEDGLFTYVWQENIMQMVFHVATLMPNRGNDVSCKQRHIGNDYVTIVYDDNNTLQYKPGSAVRGQFLSAEIIVSPLDRGFHSVRVAYHKPDMEGILQISEKRTVSDRRLGVLVRQMALHANMAAVACRYQNKSEESVSKPLARLKQIKRIRGKLGQELEGKRSVGGEPRVTRKDPGLYPLEEFSDYI